MGAVDRPVAAARAALSLELGNVVRELGGEPAQPRVFRLESCQPGAGVGCFRLANRHEAPHGKVSDAGDATRAYATSM
jgi:hypothetical protein